MKKIFTIFIAILSNLIFCFSAIGCDNSVFDSEESLANTVKYAVMFDALGGTFSDGLDRMVIETDENGTLNTLPETPTRPGYEFVSWYYCEQEIVAGKVFSSDATVGAVWKTTANSGTFGSGKVVYDKDGITVIIFPSKPNK